MTNIYYLKSNRSIIMIEMLEVCNGHVAGLPSKVLIIILKYYHEYHVIHSVFTITGAKT